MSATVVAAGEFDAESVQKLVLRNRSLRRIPPIVGRCLALTTLCVSGNELSSLRGLESLANLTALDVSRNALDSLGGGLPVGIVRIDARSNALDDLDALSGLTSLPELQSLDLRGNRVASTSHADVIELVPSLIVLNGASVALKVESRAAIAQLNELLPPPMDDDVALAALLAECGDPRWLGAQLAEDEATSDAAGVGAAADEMFNSALGGEGEAGGATSPIERFRTDIAAVKALIAEGGEETLQ
jgi:hypothetical protein